MYKKLKDGEREIKEIRLDVNTERLSRNIKRIKSDIMYTAQYDENSGTGTTYLGMPKMRRQDKLKVEHKAPITEDCYVLDKWLDCTDCKLFMSITFYLNSPSSHSLPKFISRTKNILIGNGQYIGVLFVILCCD